MKISDRSIKIRNRTTKVFINAVEVNPFIKLNKHLLKVLKIGYYQHDGHEIQNPSNCHKVKCLVTSAGKNIEKHKFLHFLNKRVNSCIHFLPWWTNEASCTPSCPEALLPAQWAAIYGLLESGSLQSTQGLEAAQVGKSAP